MKTSEQVDQIVTALALARPAFGGVHKNQENPHYGKKYADLHAILEAVAEPLAAQGIIITGGPEVHEAGGLLVSTRLIHSSGQWLEAAMLIGPGKIQEVGGNITYARRYTASAVLGLAPDDDLDGEDAAALKKQTRHPSRPEPQVHPVTNGQALVNPQGTPPRGKSTREEVAALLTVLREVCPSEAAVQEMVRAVLKMPATAPWKESLLHSMMTRAQVSALHAEAAEMVRSQGERIDSGDPSESLEAETKQAPESSTETSESHESTDSLNGDASNLEATRQVYEDAVQGAVTEARLPKASRLQD